jgi:general secretion pathway protein D
MLDVIETIDVPPSPEFHSEVIPIKYAPASAVMAALYSRSAHFDNPLKIIPDERSNSLLIFATSQDVKPIKDIVAQLDRAQAQILIEATIVRVSQKVLNRSRRNQTEESELEPANFASVVGPILHANRLSLTNFVVTAVTNTGVGQTCGFRYAARLDSDLDKMMTTIGTNHDVMILQRPRIQTSHNESATIFFGPSRPYPTGSSYTGKYGSYSTIAQLQIGCTLDLTPLINADGLAVMEIQQKYDLCAGETNIAGVGDVPITSTTESHTTIAVHDRETILLGGLVELETVRSSGVPILKHIPLLGIPFRGTSHRNRNELIVLIRPIVLPNAKVAAVRSE